MAGLLGCRVYTAARCWFLRRVKGRGEFCRRIVAGPAASTVSADSHRVRATSAQRPPSAVAVPADMRSARFQRGLCSSTTDRQPLRLPTRQEDPMMPCD